jgi:hypothetical protein
MYRTLGIISCILCLTSCAMMREGNEATTPKTGPGTEYPCGVYGVVCTDTAAQLTPDQRCCWVHSICKMDDEGPYCEADASYDPSDPTMMAKRRRLSRFRHVP